MDLKAGEPFWLLKNGRPAVYPPLTSHLKCDVVVVGGGITGALVCHQLVAEGIDTVLIDRRRIGTGSTGASTSLLQYELDTPLCELRTQIGEPHAVACYKLCRDAIDKIEKLTSEIGDTCGFERKKSVYLADSAREKPLFRSEYELRRKHGLRLDYLDRGDIENLFSFSRPAGFLSYDAGQIDAYRMALSLVQWNALRGLRVFDQTELKRYERSRSGFTIHLVGGWRIGARRLVFATGYESQRFLRQQIGKVKSTYAIASEPMARFDGWHERCLIWTSSRPYPYLRTSPDGRAIIGGEDIDDSDETIRNGLMGKKAKRLQSVFHSFFPELKFQIAYAWAGAFGVTEDSVAYIGEPPEAPGVLFALGYGANGILYGMIAAEIIRDACLHRKNPFASIFRFDR